MRDFREELKNDPCWDRSTQTLFEETGIPTQDAILQNREELIALCEFIEKEKIRSYLEIGSWTGRLVSTLHRLFDFEKVAVADLGWAGWLELPVNLPEQAVVFQGSSHTQEFMAWRHELGQIDLVMIDGDFTYQGVLTDYEINRRFPHRYLAIHNIANPVISDPMLAWGDIEGEKTEILRPHRELELEITTMGIGLVKADEDEFLTRTDAQA